MKTRCLALVTSMCLATSALSAGVPQLISYQGQLNDASGAPVPDSTYLMKFIIYDAPVGGTVLWNSQPQKVATSGGTFIYDLGSNNPLPQNLFTADTSRYLGITVGTDPEMTPRTRLNSLPFVYQALHSDIAIEATTSDNARNLGGQPPDFFLEWANITGMPVGFADGVDNEGIDAATGDDRYVLESGDTINGHLWFDADNNGNAEFWVNTDQDAAFLRLYDQGSFKVDIYSRTQGVIDLYNPRGFFSAELAGVVNGGRLVLLDTTGLFSGRISLKAGEPGDDAVQFPANALSNSEILDEAGITSEHPGGVVTIDTGSMVDLETVTITIPAAGYIYLSGRCFFSFANTTGKNRAIVQIDETAGGTFTTGYYTMAGLSSYPTINVATFSTFVDRVYFRPAGTYTFRLEAQSDPGSLGNHIAVNPWLTAMYYPTSYGSVIETSVIPGDHPDAMQTTITDFDGSTRIVYKRDLRYYEEKARSAEMARQKAEFEALKAQKDLERARQGLDDKR